MTRLLPYILLVGVVQAYSDMSYDELVDEMHSLAALIPDFVRLYSANRAYDIKPAKGMCGHKYPECEQWVLVVTDFASYEKKDAGTEAGERYETTSYYSRRPEFFTSGALHGDERVGPAATLATLRLLALGAKCLSECLSMTDAEKRALSSKKVQSWMHLLLKKRIIYAIPATNAVGFAKKRGQRIELIPIATFLLIRSRKCA